MQKKAWYPQSQLLLLISIPSSSLEILEFTNYVNDSSEGVTIMGTTLGTTLNLPSGTIWVAYQVTLGQLLVGALLVLMILTLVMRWVGDWMYWR